MPDKKRSAVAQIEDLILPPEQMRIAMDVCLCNEKAMIEYQQYNARQHRAKYKALIDSGFDKPEALELCKNIL